MVMGGALGLMTTTIPMIIATGAVVRITEVAFKKNGKPVGLRHYHFKSKGVKVAHRHEGGHISHEHKGFRGYGRTRKSLRRL